MPHTTPTHRSTRHRAALALLALLAPLTACDDPGADPGPGPVVIITPDAAAPAPDADRDAERPRPDAAGPDAAPPDAALPDAAPDQDPPDMAPPAPGGLCAPCGPGLACAEGGLCLTVQDTGESFCGAPCATPADCPRGATCLDVGGDLQCAPLGATCRNFPPPDLGGRCDGPADCTRDADRCVTAGGLDYCSTGCNTAADCPPGFDRCAAGTCRMNFELGPQGCGRDPTSPLPPCLDADAPGGGCPGALTCVTDHLDALPPTIAPFCTAPCAADADCPQGTTCHPIAPDLALCLDPRCDCLARPPEEALLDEALTLAGLDRCGAIFAQSAFDLLRPDVARDPFRLSWFDPAHRSATAGLRWAAATRRDLDARAPDAARLIAAAARLIDAPIDDAPRPIAAPGPDPLAAAIIALGAPDPTAALAPVPEGLRRRLAPLVRALAAVATARDRAATAARLDPAALEALHRLMPGTMILRGDFTTINMTGQATQRLLTGGLDLAPLYAAARDLVHLLETTDFADDIGALGFEVTLDTPLGQIILTDANPQTLVTDRPILLLVDTGGDDTWRAPLGATLDAAHPASLAIDLAGDDRYGYPGDDAPPELADLPPADAAGRYDGTHPQVADGIGPMSLSTTPRQGAGILGVGVLYDRQGDDTYRSHKLSQGAGVLGVGLLIDDDGRDDYACEQGCQGAASYGIGIHLDRGSQTDHYLGVQAIQGYAYVRALGYLHDAGGDDTYRALLGDPAHGGVWIYPNGQNEGRSNSSFAQGSGFGRRADRTDQIFASGGLGVFSDRGDGNDRYQVDVFGQGSGFWFGTGLFADGGGDDIYEGRWYVQGSGAHFAMSYFFEDGGDDTYNRPETIIATATGQGHDMSLGWLIDRAGDDTWHAPGLGLGAGNDNGIGILADLAGDDTYRVADARTFGGAAIGDRGDAFEAELCLGLFIDADGIDVYEGLEATPIANDTRWSWAERHPDHKPGERGAGIDTTGALLSLP
ncbi:MAG: hypothetical protein H6705_12455 [Myxococcales bacterium]|nr:hypothetical protein [Myxococcales bacterium]